MDNGSRNPVFLCVVTRILGEIFTLSPVCIVHPGPPIDSFYCSDVILHVVCARLCVFAHVSNFLRRMGSFVRFGNYSPPATTSDLRYVHFIFVTTNIDGSKRLLFYASAFLQ